MALLYADTACLFSPGASALMELHGTENLETPEERKRVGWEMWVRMERIIATVLREAHERQVEEVTEALQEGPEGFYKSYLYR
ncbi:MAG: hypothetical protein M3Q49_02765 [Actinomycetota bacterium]|nr:hypothetical protein [Actinomycetota bacterium]MDP9484709.1 hypothetical protein [Actinomycetota bacterium]PLS87625.1 MAG: hypothetical protein CYG60_00920 [Actinomycetota bacterium]